MPTTVTAPVPVTHAGESDPAIYVQSIVGSAFPDIVGTNTTSGGNINVEIYGPQANVDVVVTVVATTTTFTTAGKLKYIPLAPGLYTVKVTDIAAAQVAVMQIQVFGSEGV